MDTNQINLKDIDCFDWQSHTFILQQPKNQDSPHFEVNGQPSEKIGQSSAGDCITM